MGMRVQAFVGEFAIRETFTRRCRMIIVTELFGAIRMIFAAFLCFHNTHSARVQSDGAQRRYVVVLLRLHITR